MTSATGLSNDDWTAALAGAPDEAALAELRSRMLGGLRRAFRGSSRVDDGFLEDVVQEAMMKVLDGLHTFRGESRFLSWALTIASRVAWTELRRKRWKDVSLDATAGVEPADPADGFERNPERSELGALLERLIDVRLTPRQRTAIRAELAGMPQAEIGRRLGISRNAVYKLVHDARKNLKRGLEDSGYDTARTLAVIGD